MQEQSQEQKNSISRRDFFKIIGALIGTAGILEVLKLLGVYIKFMDLERQDIEYVDKYNNPEDFFADNRAWLKHFSIGANLSPSHAEYLTGQNIVEANLTPEMMCEYFKMLGITDVRMGMDMDRICASDVNAENPSVDITYYEPWLNSFRENSINLTLSTGIKTPRWPEIHIPDELLNRIYGGQIPGNGHVITPDDPLAVFSLKVQEQLFNQLVPYADIITVGQFANEPEKRFGPHAWTIDNQVIINAAVLFNQIFPNSSILCNASIEGDQIQNAIDTAMNIREQTNTEQVVGLSEYFVTPKDNGIDTRQSMGIRGAGLGGLFRSDQTGLLRQQYPGIQFQVTEFQCEKWPDEADDNPELLKPGEDWKCLAFSLIQSARLFCGHDIDIKNLPHAFPQENTLLSLWGAEELAGHYFEGSNDPNHQNITKLIGLINSAY